MVKVVERSERAARQLRQDGDVVARRGSAGPRRRAGVMDPAVAWCQPEQDGPAKRLWLRIWDTHGDAAMSANTENSNPNVNRAPDGPVPPAAAGEGAYFNPARRKLHDNRASTFNLDKNRDALIGEYGGCPWRVPGYHYRPGVLG